MASLPPCKQHGPAGLSAWPSWAADPTESGPCVPGQALVGGFRVKGLGFRV